MTRCRRHISQICRISCKNRRYIKHSFKECLSSCWNLASFPSPLQQGGGRFPSGPPNPKGGKHYAVSPIQHLPPPRSRIFPAQLRPSTGLVSPVSRTRDRPRSVVGCGADRNRVGPTRERPFSEVFLPFCIDEWYTKKRKEGDTPRKSPQALEFQWVPGFSLGIIMIPNRYQIDTLKGSK